MPRKIIIFLLAVFSSASSVYGQWIQSANGPYFDTGDGMNFLDFGSRLFAYTRFGTFYSYDNGASWVSASIDSTANPGPGELMSAQGSNLFWIWDNDSIRSNIVIEDTLFVFLSTDTGNSWSKRWSLFPPPPPGVAYIGASAFTSFRSNLLVGTATGLYRSTDSGASWLNTNVTDAGVGCFAVAGNIVYGGGVDGLFWSTDRGTTWSIRNSDFHFSTGPELATSGTNVFVCGDMSTDSGKTWNSTTCPGGISLFAYGQYLFTTLNSPMGSLYVSSNNGSTWTYISGRFHRATRCVVSGPNIVVGTTNTGTWYAPLADFGISSVSSNQSEAASVSAYPNPTPGPITLRGASGSITVTNVLGERVAGTGILEPGSGDVTLDLSKLPAGTYFARIETAGGLVIKKIIKE